MKKLFLASVLTGLSASFIGCGGGASDGGFKEPKDLADARTQLSKKQLELQELTATIENLQSYIAKHDTTQKVQKRVIVTTAPVATTTFEHFVEVQGNVTTQQDPAFASSETGGRVIELLVKEGDVVKKGDLIAKVDLESIRKSIAELETSMKLAQDIYERQENLWKQNIGSEVQYLQAKSQVESLQKTKERLEFELKKADVYAPAGGFVDMVMVKSGEMSGPGSPIVQIVNTSALKVVASVPEVYLASVKRGDKIRIVFPALGEEQMATVVQLGRMINPANRTFEIEASIDSRGGVIKPNLMASVFVKDYQKDKAIVVPSELIMQDVTGQNYVMVKDGDKAAKRPVTLGRSYQNNVVIEQGLQGSEILLVKGARQVVEGDLLDEEKQ